MTLLSTYFLPTEREPPADAEALSHKLMVRAGLIRQVGSGLWSWLPAGWRVGDKTGSGERNTANDVAVIWPPGRAPIIVAAYYTESRASDDERNAVIAEVGRIAAAV